MVAQNTSSDRSLIALMGQNYNGLVKYGTAIPVTMVTAAQMLAAKNTLQSSASDFQAKRDDLKASYDLFHPGIDALQDWLVTVRAVLARSLGETWSAAWAAAGFINNSTAVPLDNMSKIMLASALNTYFTNNPDEERADMNVTAATASTMAETMEGLQVEVTDAKEALRTSDRVRQPARVTAVKLIGKLIANLNKTLDPDDPRWIAFGLPMPASQKTPAAPQNVGVTTDSSGAVLVQCLPVPLATRYRGRMLIVGMDTKYRLVFSGVEPMGMITSVQPGVTIQIIMQAVNGSAQSVASEPVIFTVPPLPPGNDTAKLTAKAPAASAATKGNGHGNGNGASHSRRSLSRAS